MNNIDKELHEVTLGMIRDLLEKDEDDYEACRQILIAQTSDDEKLHKYILLLFEYTDKRRSLLIERKAGALNVTI